MSSEVSDSQLPPPLRLHWSQWFYPGPRRVFSTTEMARAGQQPFPSGLDWYVLSNVALLLFADLLTQPRWQHFLVTASATLALACLGLALGRWLWAGPTRLRLNLVSFGVITLFVLGASLAKRQLPPEQLRPLLVGQGVTLILMVGGLWFLTIYRVLQIEAQLRALDAQERQLKLVRRLATAQIQPHFLFNTLASIQHWVDSQDPRAGTTLSSFTRYLRATLPMFEHDSLPLREELQIVRSYLEVMQARLGQRLRWQIDIDADAEPWQHLSLPPGTLLTLTENAIGHGIEPALRGGSVRLWAQLDGPWLQLGVEDSGAGLAGPQPVHGIGLSNTLSRLQQQFGSQARLELRPLAPGCLSLITLPRAESP